MFTQIQLEDLITFALLALVTVYMVNMIMASDNSPRYSLNDKEGNVSATVFTRRPVHQKENANWYIFKFALNGLLIGFALIALAALIVGTVRGNVGDIDRGGLGHALFIWFALMQLYRAASEHYVLTSIKQLKVRAVKIDGNQHFIGKVDLLPWVIANRFFMGLGLFVSSYIFISFF